MSEFVIETGYPFPEKRSRVSLYPWASMAVGDSFFIPGATYKKISPCARAATLRNGKTFKCRNVEGGVRVWRTA